MTLDKFFNLIKLSYLIYIAILYKLLVIIFFSYIFINYINFDKKAYIK